MGAELMVAATIIGGAVDQHNKTKATLNAQAAGAKYLREYAERTKRNVSDLNFRLNKNISENLGTQIAQNSAGVAARAGQSGLGGASTEAMITQANAPIYAAAGKARSEGEATIADYQAQREEQLSNMQYSLKMGQLQQDMNEPGALSSIIGLITTGANLYTAGKTLEGAFKTETSPSTGGGNIGQTNTKLPDATAIPDTAKTENIQMELASTQKSFDNLNNIFSQHEETALTLKQLQQLLAMRQN